jgi:hypothetical protein
MAQGIDPLVESDDRPDLTTASYAVFTDPAFKQLAR